MNCPKCLSDQNVKNGFAHGNQRFKCKDCGCNFTKSYMRGHPLKDKILAVTLHLSGMSMNSIAPIIGVSTQSVMRWIKGHADTIEAGQTIDKPVEVEIDEMHHFLLKKLKQYGCGKCLITTIENSSGGFAAIVTPKLGRK